MSRDGVRFGEWEIPEKELVEFFDTSGGPGGQHANRNRTAVTLRVDLDETSLPVNIRNRIVERLGRSEIEVTSADSRSQWRNRAMARQRLSEVLEAASRIPTARKATKPTGASKRRRVEKKRRRAKTKEYRKPPKEW